MPSDTILAALITAGAAILIAFGVQLLNSHLARCAKFRDAFTEVLAALRNYVGTEAIVRGSIANHDRAIEEFRNRLARRYRLAFDKDCDDYRQCRQRFLDYAGRVGPSPDNQAANDLRRSIDHLFTYTEKHLFYPLVLFGRRLKRDFNDESP